MTATSRDHTDTPGMFPPDRRASRRARKAAKLGRVTFRGWPADALEFFDGLAADNTKAYWQDNKPRYEQTVKAPMEELLAELASEFGEGKIFRPYRDVRF